ncbi:MAG: CBS domain-containing protein [Dehalococcoidia bacterium]
MYMREYMNTSVITVAPDTLLAEAERLMRENKIRRLPVVEDDELVGLVTRRKLREATVSPATTLSVWELNYLVARMKVKDVMTTELFTVTPDTTLEEAVTRAQELLVGTLLVVDEQDPKKLVGIATTTDIYKITAQILGFGQRGARLHIMEPSRAGGCEGAASTIIARGVGIRSMMKVTPPRLGKEDCIIHVDQEDVTGLVGELRNNGYEVEVRS